MVTTGPCPRCGGLGQVVVTPCPTCRGEGRVTAEHTYQVDVPAGVDSGSTLRLAGRGAGRARGRRRRRPVRPPARRRARALPARRQRPRHRGADLDRPGRARHDRARCRRSTATRSSSSRPGTQPGREFVLRNRGVPRLQGRGRGDLRAQLVVEVPTKLDDEEAALLRQLAEQARRAREPARQGPVLADQVGVLVGVVHGRGPAPRRPRTSSSPTSPRRCSTTPPPTTSAACCACATAPRSRSPTAPARWRPCRLTATGSIADGDVAREPRPAAAGHASPSAPPKGDRLEWLVQKCTEVGVGRIVLLDAERSVVRWDGERAARQLDRLRRIAAEAAMQSRRVWLPDRRRSGAGRRRAGRRAPSPSRAAGRSAPADTSIAIGPEGGWSPAELALAADRVSLGAERAAGRDGRRRARPTLMVAACRR